MNNEETNELPNKKPNQTIQAKKRTKQTNYNKESAESRARTRMNEDNKLKRIRQNFDINRNVQSKTNKHTNKQETYQNEARA